MEYGQFKIKFAEYFDHYMEFEKHNARQKIEETLEILFGFLNSKQVHLSDVKLLDEEQVKLFNESYDLLDDNLMKYGHVDIIKRFILFLEEEEIIERHDDFFAWG